MTALLKTALRFVFLITVALFFRQKINFSKVASHRFGCCVMQASIDHGSKQQQDQIIDSIEKHCVELARDPFGNYVIQHALDLGRPDVPLRFVTKLEVCWKKYQTPLDR